MLAPEPEEEFDRQTLLLEERYQNEGDWTLSEPDETYLPVDPLRPWQRSPWPIEVTRSLNTPPLPTKKASSHQTPGY